MTKLGISILVFTIIRCLVSLINLIAHKMYKFEVPDESNTSYVKNHLSILIPMRNEENNIQHLLSDLVKISGATYEIIVYDDLSTDGSASIVEKFSKYHKHIRLIKGLPLPVGWLGKNHACFQLARIATGDKLMFLDADVRIKPDLVRSSMIFLEKNKLKLLSIFPVQDMPGRGTQFAVPLMNRILLTLLPLPMVCFSSWSAFSAANGQFMLFNAKEYQLVQPHYQCRSNRVEDIAIQREYKKRRLKVATLVSDGNIHCTMYRSLNEAITGFSKNIFHFFGGSLFLTYLFAAITTIAPFWFFVMESIFWTGIYLILVFFMNLFVSVASHQHIFLNLIFLIPQQFVLWRIILLATISRSRNNIIWKDRNILDQNTSEIES